MKWSHDGKFEKIFDSYTNPKVLIGNWYEESLEFPGKASFGGPTSRDDYRDFSKYVVVDSKQRSLFKEKNFNGLEYDLLFKHHGDWYQHCRNTVHDVTINHKIPTQKGKVKLASENSGEMKIPPTTWGLRDKEQVKWGEKIRPYTSETACEYVEHDILRDNFKGRIPRHLSTILFEPNIGACGGVYRGKKSAMAPEHLCLPQLDYTVRSLQQEKPRRPLVIPDRLLHCHVGPS